MPFKKIKPFVGALKWNEFLSCLNALSRSEHGPSSFLFNLLSLYGEFGLWFIQAGRTNNLGRRKRCLWRHSMKGRDHNCNCTDNPSQLRTIEMFNLRNCSHFTTSGWLLSRNCPIFKLMSQKMFFRISLVGVDGEINYSKMCQNFLI